MKILHTPEQGLKGICLIAIGLLATTATGQIVLEQAGTIEVGAGPASIQAADLNGDTFLDLVTANEGDGTLSLMLGNGDGTFEAPVSISVGVGPRWLSIADLNGDNRLDLAVADYDGNQVAILHNLGGAVFDAPIYHSVPLHAVSICVGDLDGDGWLDVAVGLCNDEGGLDRNTLAILQNDGQGTLLAPDIVFANTTTIWGIGTGDLDGDSDLDLLMPSHWGGTGWMVNDGFGVFQRNGYGINAGTSRVVAIDMNGDDKIDVVGAYYYGPSGIKWALGQGDGTFVSSAQYEVPGGGQYTDLRAADFDGDGYPDFIATTDSDSPGYRIYYNNGDGSMSGQSYDSLGEAPQSVAVGDFDGDGHPDAAIADDPTSTVFLLHNATPDPLLVDPVVTSLSLLARDSMQTVDVDGDTDLDIVALLTPDNGQFTHGQAAVFLNNGQGGFGTPTLYETGAQPYYLDVGDLNGDDHPDIVVSNSWDSDVSIFYNDGNGQFSPRQTLQIGGALLFGIAIGDMDNDNRADIVLAGYQSRGILIAFQDEFGAFEIVDHPLDSREYLGVALADFNGDGFLDVVTGANTGRFASVFLNTGLRSLDRSVLYEVSATPRSLTVADFDGDDHMDVAFGVEHNISVLYGVGDGTFGEAVLYPTPSAVGVVDIKAADLNNDDHVDLVGAEVANRRVVVLLNDGAGGLVESGGAYSASYPHIIAAGDFDGDDDVDVAIISRPELEIPIKRLTVYFNSTISDPGGAESLHLQSSTFVRDHQAQLIATRARGSEQVYFLLSTRGLGAGPRVPVLGGMQLDLRNPISIIDSAFADSLGRATLQLRIPPGAPPVMIGLQAVVRRGSRGRDSLKSNPVLTGIE